MKEREKKIKDLEFTKTYKKFKPGLEGQKGLHLQMLVFPIIFWKYNSEDKILEIVFPIYVP